MPPTPDDRQHKPLERKHYTLEEINEMTLLPYARTMALVFANAAWVPVLAFPHRPFRNLSHLLNCMATVLRSSDENSKLEVIDQQPDLVDPPPPEDDVSEFQFFYCDLSFRERLNATELARLQEFQQLYYDKFGFILVFDPANKTIPHLLSDITARMQRTREEEFKRAIEEAIRLAFARLQELLPNVK